MSWPTNMASGPKWGLGFLLGQGHDRHAQGKADGLGDGVHLNSLFGNRVILCPRLTRFQYERKQAGDIRDVSRGPTVETIADIGGHALLPCHHDSRVTSPCFTMS